jgi:hypothetical protein
VSGGAAWRAGGAQVGVVTPGGSELVAGIVPEIRERCAARQYMMLGKVSTLAVRVRPKANSRRYISISSNLAVHHKPKYDKPAEAGSRKRG